MRTPWALVLQAHAQVKVACLLAQAFALMIRCKDAPALEPWLEEASSSEVPELRTFAAGIRRDQAAVLAALTYEWSQGQVEGQTHRLKLLKRQAYGRRDLICYDIGCWLALLELCTEDAGDPF